MQVRMRWVLAGFAAAGTVGPGFLWLGLSPALSGPPVSSRANASIRPFGYDCAINFMGNGSGAFVGGTANNIAPGTDAFVGAGSGNIACDNNTSVVGGFNNNVTGNTTTQAEDAFIGGGSSNTISEAYSAIAAGESNTANAFNAFIGSGQSNSIAAAATDSAIAGGYLNSAGNSYAAVGGGTKNDATGVSSTIAGGAFNSAPGTHATVPGGYDNLAEGQDSFAAGSQAKARNAGTFVWSDDASTSPLQSKANFQFLARASGGFYLYSNAAATIGVKLAPNSGMWGSASDRNMKSNVVPLDDAAVLAKVASLPISEWSYKTEGGVRHVGPMAQDFYAAFRVGEDDLHITSIDEDGVALAAIKALHAENAKMRADNATLHSENVALRDRLAALEQKVDALAKGRSER